MQKIEEGLHGARASSLWRDCASGGLQHKGVMLVHPGTAKALFQPFCLSNPLLGLRAGDREWNANCTGARFIALWRSLANSTHLRTALSPKKLSSFAIRQVFVNVTSKRDFPLNLRLSKLLKTFKIVLNVRVCFICQFLTVLFDSLTQMWKPKGDNFDGLTDL